jgi:hypothetical protein
MRRETHSLASSLAVTAGTVSSFPLPDTTDASAIVLYVEYVGTINAGSCNLYEQEPVSTHYFPIAGGTFDATHSKFETTVSPLNAQNYLFDALISSGSNLLLTVTVVYEYGSDE